MVSISRFNSGLLCGCFGPISLKLTVRPETDLFYIHTLSTISSLRVITHGKVLTDESFLHNPDSRDMVTVIAATILLHRDQILVLPITGPWYDLKRRLLGKSSRCHRYALVKRQPWDSCYSWEVNHTPVHVSLTSLGVNIIPTNVPPRRHSPRGQSS